MSETSAESAPPGGGDSPLVESEGVNAGSKNHETERDVSSPRAGGDASGAPGSAMQTDVDPSDDEGDELVGTSDVSEGGQDEGSID